MSSNRRGAATSSSPDWEKETGREIVKISDIDDIDELDSFALNNTVLRSILLTQPESQHRCPHHPDRPLWVNGDRAVIRNEENEINEQLNEKSDVIWSRTVFIKGNGFHSGLGYGSKTTRWNQDINLILQNSEMNTAIIKDYLRVTYQSLRHRNRLLEKKTIVSFR